ncbi:ABC transporter ATP-binding protein [Candidatus Fermentibacteria bacterium]|nr:ABC transporter ATP-binding protein [Candidatus Fermentibacteria bacterium]
MKDRIQGKGVEGSSRSSVRLLAALLLRHKRQMTIGLLGLIGVDALQLVIPKITQYVVDDLARGVATVPRLWVMGGAIVGVAALMAGCRFVWRFFVIRSSHRIERDLRQDLYDHLITLSPQFYDENKVGDLMAHATNDLNAVRMATGMASLVTIDALFLAIACIGIMVSMDARLTMLALLPLPLLSVVMLRFGSLVHDRFTAVQDAFSRLSERVQESFSGIRVVKAYGDEESEFLHFAQTAGRSRDENIRLGRLWGMFEPLIGGLALTSIAILLGAGGRMVVYGRISLGEFVAFFSYLHMLIWPMMAAGWVVNILQRGTASMDRLQTLFHTRPDIVGGHLDAPDSPSIAVHDLSFSYPGTSAPVLRNVSFSLRAGATLGIVGRTGSGKTTLVELLMRLYDPPPGTVFIGDVDVRTMELPRLRELFGFVPQETFLFAMSIADNIAFGCDSLSRDEVISLGIGAQIHDEVVNFPDGYDTMIGERGVTLSGGQKQRVAIARAMAVQPPVLILDDALSSVDTETEAALQDDVALRHGRTTILIAHRISTVRNADLIIVLDDGRLIDAGTHDDLLRRGGFYAELFRMQQQEEDQCSEPPDEGPFEGADL